jgi:hypothetical protein
MEKEKMFMEHEKTDKELLVRTTKPCPGFTEPALDA